MPANSLAFYAATFTTRFGGNKERGIGTVSPRVPLIEVLMITNQGYWLLMVNIELIDRLKLIKYQMKIFQG